MKETMRTAARRVRGLGAAGCGTRTSWHQRHVRPPAFR